MQMQTSFFKGACWPELICGERSEAVRLGGVHVFDPFILAKKIDPFILARLFDPFILANPVLT